MSLLLRATKAICYRLAPLGWRFYFLHANGGNLDISQPTADALGVELTKKLSMIDRTSAGLEDFASSGQRAITAGLPAQSLLYHALASPLVQGDHNNTPFLGYATPAELDTLENLIFSLVLPDLATFGGADQVRVAVFSTEYRPAAGTVDGLNADLVFSRTGIARVGTADPFYSPETRGFWPGNPSNARTIRVVPARFSAWLAVKEKKWIRELRRSPSSPGSCPTPGGISGCPSTRFSPARNV